MNEHVDMYRYGGRYVHEDIEGEFELEEILDHDEKRKMYYCKWKNYDEIYRSTWEPRAHLAEVKTRAQTKLLDDHEKRHNLLRLIVSSKVRVKFTKMVTPLCPATKFVNAPTLVVKTLS